MHGTVTMLKPPRVPAGERVTITPEMATGLLEHNQNNRPLADAHVKRIARQIIDGKWRFNGDTIKISSTGDVLDGQHRLWAIIEAQQPVETIIVEGIEPEAFATVDTLRKPRSIGDVVALNGAGRYRNQIAGALAWLLRWQRGCLEKYKAPENRIENSDIEAAYLTFGDQMERAIERAMGIRKVMNPALCGFIFFVAYGQNAELAEQFVTQLDNPGRLPQSHPFFQLRDYLTNLKLKRTAVKDPLYTIALSFKALNAAHAGRPLSTLLWRSQGSRPEPFPILKITPAKQPKKEAA